MDDAPVPRIGARVLLVDADGRVLLFHGHDPATPSVRYWFTVGGGLDDGETPRTGAARELFEETGLRVQPGELVGPVHFDVAEFPFAGRRYRQQQDYFVVRVGAWTVDTSGFEQLETESIVGHRWWSAAELRATDESYYPPELPELLERVLGGESAQGPSVDSGP